MQGDRDDPTPDDPDHDGPPVEPTVAPGPPTVSLPPPTDAPVAPDVWADTPLPSLPRADDAPGHVASDPRLPADPHLPASEARQPGPVAPEPRAPTPGAPTWYRSDRDRYRSVHRRANPWYRRLGRGVVGLTFVAATGAGLYFGAQLVQDFLDRERLPAEGANVPTVRSTTFEIRSTSPAPVVDGTLTLDTATGAFEFVGRGTGPQATTQVVSPDGDRLFIRSNDGPWISPGPGDVVANDVATAAAYLADDDSADDILTRELRRRHVELLDRVEVGTGDDELRRYEMEFDTAAFRDSSPIEFQSFQERAIPGVVVDRNLEVAISLDRDDLLVAVDDAGSNWSWQRLDYSDRPFTPIDPAVDPLAGPVVGPDQPTDG